MWQHLFLDSTPNTISCIPAPSFGFGAVYAPRFAPSWTKLHLKVVYQAHAYSHPIPFQFPPFSQAEELSPPLVYIYVCLCMPYIVIPFLRATTAFLHYLWLFKQDIAIRAVFLFWGLLLLFRNTPHHTWVCCHHSCDPLSVVGLYIKKKTTRKTSLQIFLDQNPRIKFFDICNFLI